MIMVGGAHEVPWNVGWRSEDSFVALVFSFYLSMGSGDHVIRLVWQAV